MALFDLHGLKETTLHKRGLLNRGLGKGYDLTEGRRLPGHEYVIHTDFESCEAEWRTFEDVSISTPFQSLAWLKCWWEAYQLKEQNHELDLQIIFVYDSQKLVLILPLVIEHYKNVRRLSWLCSHLSDYNAPLIETNYLSSLTNIKIDQIWADVLAQVPDIDILFLAKQPEQIGNQTNPFHSYRAYDYRLRYHTAWIKGDWQKYYSGRRSAKSRSRLRSKANYMQKKAGMVIRECHDGDERANIVMTTINWKRTQVMASGAIDPFGDVETALFFENFSKIEELSSKFRVFSAEVDGKPLACAFGLMSEGGFILYQTAYDEGEFVRRSPGVHLLVHMMEKFADEGHEFFDFSIGDEPYKFDWADGHYELSLSVRSNSWKGMIAEAVIVSKLNLKGWIKASDKRFAFVKSVNRQVRRISGR